MDFIERWFHLSPDGGNGSLELVYLLAIVAIVTMILFRRQLRQLYWRARDRQEHRHGGS